MASALARSKFHLSGGSEDIKNLLLNMGVVFNVLGYVFVFLIFFNWYNGGWSPIGSTLHYGHQ
jgi:hypothetical protein